MLLVGYRCVGSEQVKVSVKRPLSRTSSQAENVSRPTIGYWLLGCRAVLIKQLPTVIRSTYLPAAKVCESMSVDVWCAIGNLCWKVDKAGSQSRAKYRYPRSRSKAKKAEMPEGLSRGSLSLRGGSSWPEWSSWSHARLAVSAEASVFWIRIYCTVL